ncbi:hypothetical protein [Asticcacaulis benevestitus]|uniref:Uncharacterized protein n=1 Tax=Asticcacaulis benevestitus DSM 16100 = ATCC BAA-896 TaxID=1121022 RepID=V4NFS1_9CAUL|nr:hypothetical protein [Asticcacaulis benevestitus]ESQ80712.1 hypothetical protein ABENE_22220 [Asticcacaulis benevestitus DSM 16100 = ATCC BAA-896]
MTEVPIPTPFASPFDMATLYAAAFGLFAPGLLMAARRQMTASTPQPSQGQST